MARSSPLAHHGAERVVDRAPQRRLVGPHADGVDALPHHARVAQRRAHQAVAVGDDVVEHHAVEPALLEVEVGLLGALVEHDVETRARQRRSRATATRRACRPGGPAGRRARGPRRSSRRTTSVAAKREVRPRERDARAAARSVTSRPFRMTSMSPRSSAGTSSCQSFCTNDRAHAEAARQRVGDLDLEADDAAGVVAGPGTRTARRPAGRRPSAAPRSPARGRGRRRRPEPAPRERPAPRPAGRPAPWRPSRAESPV